MVGIDLLPQAQGLLDIDAQHRAEAADRLRERHRGAAVQHAEGLVGVLVHRHGGAQEVRADLGDADAEIAGETAAPAFGEGFGSDAGAPDAHRI